MNDSIHDTRPPTAGLANKEGNESLQPVRYIPFGEFLLINSKTGELIKSRSQINQSDHIDHS